jgi:cobalt-zinc-cadmium efflux system protein
MMHNHSSHREHENNGRKRLILALAITGCWFLIELAGGLYANSLALLADAAHMLTDVAALGMSLFALKISTRPATPGKTYGYLRAEILAALANGIFLILITAYIFYEAYERFGSPPKVKSAAMVAIAVTGLIANLVTARLLYPARQDNLNLRGAFLHVLGDTLGSVGAILAGILMMIQQWYLADPIVSAIVGGLILYGAWNLVAESVDILLESTPRHLNVSDILVDLRGMPGVASVHDLHVWSIASEITAMSSHIVLQPAEDAGRALAAASLLMREKYGIEHTTIQIEYENWTTHPGGHVVGPQFHHG